ncbi:MAG: lysophospholipid acyltransferase family protein [Gemmataceae bacterium]
MERYFLEPYRFIPPHRSTFWCRAARGVVMRHLRKNLGIQRWQFRGEEHLRQSLEQKAGILLTPNHCRWADPTMVGLVARHLGAYLYFVASYHLFRQSKFMGWFLNRLGGYSIWREGLDRESIRTTAEILASAERPVVLFPEGTWFRQNDRVGLLQDGLSLITRQAARQSTRPIVIHPVGIKYWVLSDPSDEIDRRLERLEQRLGWSAQRSLSTLARLEKLGGALLGLKEIEFLGSTTPGNLDARLKHLAESQVERIERQHLGKKHSGWLLERIRRLRQHLTRQLLEKTTEAERIIQVRKDLDDLLFCENLNAQSFDYVSEHPSFERIGETIQRIEETLSDEIERPIAPLGATIVVGPAIDVRSQAERPGTAGGESLVDQLRTSMQGLIDQLLEEGPPSAWGCPSQPTAPRALSVPTAGRTDPGRAAVPTDGQLIG